MGKFTEEEIKFLEENVEVMDWGTSITPLYRIESINTHVFGDIKGNVMGDIQFSVQGDIKNCIMGSVGGDIWGNVNGKIRGKIGGGFWFNFWKLVKGLRK